MSVSEADVREIWVGVSMKFQSDALLINQGTYGCNT
jgi:hypothetical protein